MIDNLFPFSRPIGSNYQGVWISRRIFMITVTDIGITTLIDGIKCCDGIFWKVEICVNILLHPPPLQLAEASKRANGLVNRKANFGVLVVHWGRIFQMHAKNWKEMMGSHILEFHHVLVRVQKMATHIIDLA